MSTPVQGRRAQARKNWRPKADGLLLNTKRWQILEWHWVEGRKKYHIEMTNIVGLFLSPRHCVAHLMKWVVSFEWQYEGRRSTLNKLLLQFLRENSANSIRWWCYFQVYVNRTVYTDIGGLLREPKDWRPILLFFISYNTSFIHIRRYTCLDYHKYPEKPATQNARLGTHTNGINI